MIGWEEVAAIDDLQPTSVVQHWNNAPLTTRAKQQGAKLIMSPAARAYLDMKYDAATPVGGTWAGFIDERRAYEWDPATQVPGVGEADILGVEAPLWSETIRHAARGRAPDHAPPRRLRRDRLVARGRADLGRIPDPPRHPRARA